MSMLRTVSGPYEKLHKSGLLISLRQLLEMSVCQHDCPAFLSNTLGHSCAPLLANAQFLLLCHLGTQSLRTNPFVLTQKTMLNTHY